MNLDDSWKQLQQVNAIVRYADARAGLILTLNDFVKLAQDPEQMQREIAAHVWANSLVAGGKHRHVQRGPRFLDEALAVLAVMVVVAAVVGEFGG